MRSLPALLLALACACASAQQATDYQASVPVPDQSPGTRDKAMREALATVASRVGGVPANAPQLEGLLGRAQQYVQHYGFARDAANQLQFTAAFDPRAVDGAIRGLGLAVWGRTSGAVEDVEMQIGNIRGAADYAKALSALRTAGGVSSVRVLEAEGDRIHVRVRAEGGAARMSALPGTVLSRDASRPGIAYVLN